MLQKTNLSWSAVSLSERVKITLERRNRHHGSILPSSGQRFPVVVRIMAELRRDSKEDKRHGTKIRNMKVRHWLRFVVDTCRDGMSARHPFVYTNHSEPTLCPRTTVNSTPSGDWTT